MLVLAEGGKCQYKFYPKRAQTGGGGVLCRPYGAGSACHNYAHVHELITHLHVKLHSRHSMQRPSHMPPRRPGDTCFTEVTTYNPAMQLLLLLLTQNPVATALSYFMPCTTVDAHWPAGRCSAWICHAAHTFLGLPGLHAACTFMYRTMIQVK